MPELPEVEVTRTSLAGRIFGARVVAVRLGKPLRWPLGCDPTLLVGQRVGTLRRRGKYLVLELDRGLLLLHLGMSGSLGLSDAPPAHGAHDHFDLVTDHGVLRLRDPRRFGAVVFAEDEQAPVARKLLGRLGVEPLSDDFEPNSFHLGLKRRNAAIKQVLLAGDLVVGVGNIYACEALFLAGIRPTLSASRLSLARVQKLHAAVRDVLQRAVDKGGSTLRDFSNGRGEAGYFQLEAMVYDRSGLPCRICAAPICTIRQGQRATHFCPRCQRR